MPNTKILLTYETLIDVMYLFLLIIPLYKYITEVLSLPDMTMEE